MFHALTRDTPTIAPLLAVCRRGKTAGTWEHLPPMAEPVHATRRCAALPVLSHVPHLLHADQCRASIRPLGWKERPLHCPRGQRHPIGPWGTEQYRPRGTRSWGHRCMRTFNDLPDPLRHRRQRPRSYWMRATVLVCLACSSRRIARELGMHGRTSDRWCGWLRKVAWSSARHRRLEGPVDTEDLSHTAGTKGHAQRGGKKALGRCARGRRTKRESGRGHDDTDRPARLAWISRVLSVPAERPSLEGVWAGRTGLAGGLRAVSSTQIQTGSMLTCLDHGELLTKPRAMERHACAGTPRARVVVASPSAPPPPACPRPSSAGGTHRGDADGSRSCKEGGRCVMLAISHLSWHGPFSSAHTSTSTDMFAESVRAAHRAARGHGPPLHAFQCLAQRGGKPCQSGMASAGIRPPHVRRYGCLPRAPCRQQGGSPACRRASRTSSPGATSTRRPNDVGTFPAHAQPVGPWSVRSHGDAQEKSTAALLPGRWHQSCRTHGSRLEGRGAGRTPCRREQHGPCGHGGWRRQGSPHAALSCPWHGAARAAQSSTFRGKDGVCHARRRGDNSWAGPWA